MSSQVKSGQVRSVYADVMYVCMYVYNNLTNAVKCMYANASLVFDKNFVSNSTSLMYMYVYDIYILARG